MGPPQRHEAALSQAAVSVSPPPLGWPTKIAYAIGGIPPLIEQRAFSAFLLLFYNQVVGLPAHIVATVLLVVSICDALFDPAIGHISDHYRSRWGRRHPFIYMSVAPVSIGFLLIWMPPVGWSQTMQAGWLASTLLLVRFFDTFYELPSSALLPELTRNYDERTRVISLRSLFGLLGAMVLMMLAYKIFLRENPDGTGGVLARSGYFGFGLAAALIIAVSMLIAAIGTHHRIPYLSKPAPRSATLGAMFREVGATLNNQSFIALLVAGMLMSIANGSRLALELYFNLYFWALSQAQLAALVPATLIGIVLGVASVSFVSRRLGKRRAAAYVIAGAIVGNVGPVLGRLIGIVPANGSTALFAILFVDLLFTFWLATMTTILVTSMMNDVVEDVEVKTGRRSEGLLLAADNMFKKLVSSVGIFVSGWLLTLIAFPQRAERGSVPPEIVGKLAYGYIPIAILYLVALAMLYFYRIDRGSHEANLGILQARQAADPKTAATISTV